MTTLSPSSWTKRRTTPGESSSVKSTGIPSGPKVTVAGADGKNAAGSAPSQAAEGGARSAGTANSKVVSPSESANAGASSSGAAKVSIDPSQIQVGRPSHSADPTTGVLRP